MCVGDDARRRMVQPQSERSTNEQLASLASQPHAPVSDIDVDNNLLPKVHCLRRYIREYTTLLTLCLQQGSVNNPAVCVVQNKNLKITNLNKNIMHDFLRILKIRNY